MKLSSVILLFLAALVFASMGCRTASPDAGHEVVLIDKPYFFGHGGVETEPVRTGLTLTAVTTDQVDVSMLPEKFDTELPDP